MTELFNPLDSLPKSIRWVLYAFVGLVLVAVTITLLYLSVQLGGQFMRGFERAAEGKSFFIYEFEQRDIVIQDCLRSEKYTRQECILIAKRK